jgi:hypothetical protein
LPWTAETQVPIRPSAAVEFTTGVLGLLTAASGVLAAGVTALLTAAAGVFAAGVLGVFNVWGCGWAGFDFPANNTIAIITTIKTTAPNK